MGPTSYHSIRSPLVTFHVLIEEEGFHLIDTGFLGDIARLERWLSERDLDLSRLQTILLTHGHLDHTLNAATLKARSGCRILAPELDRSHVSGEHPYRAMARYCGLLEHLGRRVLRYEVPKVDEWFQPGENLDLWGGLRVIHLPGHTMGHCGFYQKEQRLLFCGDLYASQYWDARVAPPWFNVDTLLARESIRSALSLDLEGVVPNHGRNASPKQHLEDLRRIGKRIQRSVQSTIHNSELTSDEEGQ